MGLRHETWPRDGLIWGIGGPIVKPEVEQLVRDYADGKVSWQTVRNRGFDNYLDLLGELGLRPPRAPLQVEGPAREALLVVPGLAEPKHEP